MARLSDRAQKVRSKNAGPFWLTIDIFCDSAPNFDALCRDLQTAQVAALFAVPEGDIKRFDIPSLNVIKLSLPRPYVQGSVADRDLHGASWGALLADLELAD